jgi:hypothetical protein
MGALGELAATLSAQAHLRLGEPRLQDAQSNVALHERFYGNQGRTEGELSTLRRTEHPGRQRTNRTVRKLVKNVFATLLFLTPTNTQ